MIFEDTHVVVILVEILNSIVNNRVISWNPLTPIIGLDIKIRITSKFVVEQLAIQCNGSHLGYNLEFHLSANDVI